MNSAEAKKGKELQFYIVSCRRRLLDFFDSSLDSVFFENFESVFSGDERQLDIFGSKLLLHHLKTELVEIAGLGRGRACFRIVSACFVASFRVMSL